MRPFILALAALPVLFAGLSVQADPAIKAEQFIALMEERLEQLDARAACIGAGCAVEEAVSMRARDILASFELNSDRLTAASREVLDEFVRAIKRDSLGLVFVIQGHTDASGDEAYNQALSERRAGAVAAYIAAAGIDPSRLVTRGVGEHGLDPEWAPTDPRNRRVVWDIGVGGAPGPGPRPAPPGPVR